MIELTFVPAAKPLLLQGSPNFGMIGTIVTEFLISHLSMRKIGRILLDSLPPVIAVHNGDLLDPVGLYYDEKTNIVVVHIAISIQGHEWTLAKELVELQKKLDCSEFICTDGIYDESVSEQADVFFYTSDITTKEKLKTLGLLSLTGGVISGLSAILAQIHASTKLTAFLATTHAQYPDSSAAATIIAALDLYLNLDVDPEPLLEQAQVLEEKWQKIAATSAQSLDEKEKKQLSYVG